VSVPKAINSINRDSEDGESQRGDDKRSHLDHLNRILGGKKDDYQSRAPSGQPGLAEQLEWWLARMPEGRPRHLVRRTLAMLDPNYQLRLLKAVDVALGARGMFYDH
jgi:hypothetical protein